MLLSKVGIRRRILELYLLVTAVCCLYYIWISNTKHTPGLIKSILTTKRKARPSVGFPELQGSDCEAAFSSRSKNHHFFQRVERISIEQIRNDTKNCEKFKMDYGFNRYPPPTTEELEFPLAFAVLFHKDLDQVLYLLRAVYRPHNVYCLSVDMKTDYEFVAAVRAVAGCFNNTILASKMERIVYAGFERLKADINCMVDLAGHPVQWKYVLNMVGQQFPLRTNLETVRILKMYKGTSEVEVLPASRTNDYRYIYKHVYKSGIDTSRTEIHMTYEKNPPPPHGIEIRKGSVFGSFSRDFIEYVISEPMVKDFLDWCKTVYSPDEYFWSSLQFGKELDVPGGYGGLLPDQDFVTVYVSWLGKNPCSTRRVRSICIFSTEDLPILDKKPHLFANKFYISHHPAALHCLDERIYNNTVNNFVRNLTYYENQVAKRFETGVS